MISASRHYYRHISSFLHFSSFLLIISNSFLALVLFFVFEVDSSQSDKLASFEAPVLQFYTVRHLPHFVLKNTDLSVVKIRSKPAWQNRFDTWRRDYVWVREEFSGQTLSSSSGKKLIGQILCILTHSRLGCS